MADVQLKIQLKKLSEKKVCVFTGHRQIQPEFDYASFEQAVERYVQEGVDTFLTGMAIGFDLYSAEYVIKLKEKYPAIKLCACIPCAGQEKYYSLTDKERYLAILKKCDERMILSESYYKGCMHVRNNYMVDKADCMIAYFIKDNGGTAYTIKQFEKKKPQGEITIIK